MISLLFSLIEKVMEKVMEKKITSYFPCVVQGKKENNKYFSFPSQGKKQQKRFHGTFPVAENNFFFRDFLREKNYPPKGG